MEPLAALSPQASRCPAKPDTDGVATTVERFAPDIPDGYRAALRLREVYRRGPCSTSVLSCMLLQESSEHPLRGVRSVPPSPFDRSCSQHPPA